uniref:Secreted protein n=1 Tax=Gloeothece verrucosa (strain PCC 7822) TaxID=497965 RepID=E0UAZ8_GLOV7|nr:hypothetical protein Cyan7822_3166 [Gloeothece verrucosa PCC 7822]
MFLCLFFSVFVIVQLISALGNPLAAQDNIPVVSTEKLEQTFTPINKANENPFADSQTVNQSTDSTCTVLCPPYNRIGRRVDNFCVVC